VTIETFSLLFGLCVSGAIVTLVLGLWVRARMRSVEVDRLFTSGTRMSLEDLELSQSFGDRVVRPGVSSLLRLLARLAPKRNLDEIEHRLELAGRPYGWSVVDFMGLRVLSAGTFAFLYLMLTFLGDQTGVTRILFAVVIGFFGFYLPSFWLSGRVSRRKNTIRRALPDGLDMLNVCVSAGLGFDAALSRVSERWRGPLADELNRVFVEIRLGTPRRQALQDLVYRTGVLEVENFVATILQADQLGVSIAKVLETQAEQMRILRRQRAEEEARQATIKLLFPLVFLIFPAMLAVLLGPAVPQLIETLSDLSP
jgi:tight adherence protein C